MSFGKNISPARWIVLGFASLIAVGAAALLLPFATKGPGSATPLQALFTAVSATCVTGLVVCDTATTWSGFGQAVILFLIQVGGMGVVTVALSIFIFSGRKIGLGQRWVMQESICAPQVGGIVRMTGFLLKAAFAMEGIGAVLLAIRFCPTFGLWRGLWYAVFHAVSAFCNAGFDLMGVRAPFSSLTAYSGDPLLIGTISLLIIAGGVGFLLWQDVRTHGLHLSRYRLQSKLVLCVTAVLLVGGFAFFWLYELRLPQWESLTAGERALSAAFLSVTPRTAGFNSVEVGQLSEPGKLVTIALMLIGGASGSTAGGFKVTTLAVLLLGVRSVFRGDAHCFGRRLSPEVRARACALFILYLGLFLVGGTLICCIDGIPLLSALFEAASAIGTVGLTAGTTGALSAASQIILILLMYFGRVGGLTLLYAVSAGGAGVQYPQEAVTVG